MSILELIYKERKKFILAPLLGFLVGYLSSFLLTDFYKSESKLFPSDINQRSSISSSANSLQSLIGVSAGIEPRLQRYFSILNSDDFIFNFLTSSGNIDKFLNKSANINDLNSEDILVINAIKDFSVRKFKQHFSSKYEIKTGEITFDFIWSDPVLSSQLLTEYISFFNKHVAELDILKAESNIEYLNNYYNQNNQSPNLESLKTISALLTYETNRIMYATTTDSYAFEVIDSAAIPRERFKPNRFFLGISSALVSFIIMLTVSLFPILKNKIKIS